MSGWTFDERFKAWAEREGMTLVTPSNMLEVVISKRMEAAYLGGLQARDAEVQRLLTALTNMFAAFDDPFTTAQVEAHQSAVMLLAEYLPEKGTTDE